MVKKTFHRAFLVALMGLWALTVVGVLFVSVGSIAIAIYGALL